jgi:acyl-CoA reductase-like NAD-dependent aldehyde dehydrogenase
MVLKPAEQTPLSALVLAELTDAVGFPPGVFNVLPGFGPTAGAALAVHPGVAKISFTGSTEVGREILRGSAVDFKRVSVELGGKSSTIVLKDAVEADLRRAANNAAWAIYANTGQVCSAGSRLLVEEGAYDALTETLAEVARKIPVGHGLSDGVRMGPLVSDDQLQRVLGYVSKGRDEGATVLAGGERVGSEGYFLAPTALAGVRPESALWQEEIFGPVVCAAKFGDLDEALAMANDTNYGLAAGIFTRDLAKAHYLADHLHVGTVWINTYNLFDPAVPWGGFKDSGIGRDNGRNAMDMYTEEKVVWMGLG